VSYETGGAGNYAQPLTASFDAGRHRVTFVRGGGSLRPGDASPGRLTAIVFEPVDRPSELRSASPARWRSVCRQPVDWLEVVRPG